MALAAQAHHARALGARSFRDALGRFPTGVAFVTAAPDGEPTGLIVNSLTSVWLDPPLVSFRPSRRSLTWSRMRRAKRFGVNVLGRHHERFAMRAAPAGAERFAGLGWELGPRGGPLLTDALATLECEIHAEHPAGDPWIVVGRVDDVRTSPLEDPLVFFAGAFGALQPITLRRSRAYGRIVGGLRTSAAPDQPLRGSDHSLENLASGPDQPARR